MSRLSPASVAAPTREGKASKRPALPAAERPAPSARLGQVPIVAFLAAVGLLACAMADALSRATLTPPSIIYWAGLLLIVLPIFYRLCSPQPSSGERLTLVCLLGLVLYGVKLARDSLVYTFPDELVHAFNADAIAGNHELFTDNSLLPVTPDYPGLEGATSALMTLTGMSSFGAGILVVGAARLILMIGLFLLFRRISGSARLAGVASAIYVANANFLLWGAQFSYQSLALPLLVLVIVALAERHAAPRSETVLWAIPVVLGTIAVAVTHHVTSYLLVATIVALMVAERIAGRDATRPSLWPFAALAAALSVIWPAFIATGTAAYLWAPLSEALTSIGETLTGQVSLRELFAPDSGARAAGLESAPALARIMSFTSVLILLLALPFGLLRAWRRYRTHPFALLLCAAAIGFFGALSLRFISAAWETGNRASEFLFIGLAFVTALVVLDALSRLSERRPRFAPWQSRAVVTALFGVVLVGGAIAGWPWDSHLAQPVRVEFGDRSIESEPLSMARWIGEELPEGRFAAPQTDARFLVAPGGVAAFAGLRPDFQHTLEEPILKSWQLPLLRGARVRYVVVDRRRRSHDIVRGYAFGVQPPGGPIDRVLPRSVVTKWEQLPTAARLFHSGQIAVFDLEARR